MFLDPGARKFIGMNISCVHRNIPKDLTLSAEERLVVLPIEVRRT
jgi:hypothetical protein